jgi:Fur family iron response transcriptional regulator
VGDGQDRHVTAESLFALTGGAGEKVSLATVYNTLRAFCEAGLVNEVVVDGARSYFDTRIENHPHFYWEETHALTDAPADEVTIAALPAAPLGTEIARVDVVIRLRRA